MGDPEEDEETLAYAKFERTMFKMLRRHGVPEGQERNVFRALAAWGLQANEVGKMVGKVAVVALAVAACSLIVTTVARMGLPLGG